MGEEKANQNNQRLLVRMRVPSFYKMVVQVEVGRGYLGQCLMLMLICEGQTDNGRRRRQVIVESHSQLDVALYSKIDIQMAGFEGTSEGLHHASGCRQSRGKFKTL